MQLARGARRAGLLLSLTLLALTGSAWVASRASPYGITVERYRAYSVVSHAGVIRLSATERLRSDPATGREQAVPYGQTWRVHSKDDWADDFLVRLALGEPNGRSFGVVRDLHGLTGPVPGGSPDFEWTRPRTDAAMFPHWAAAAAFALAPGAWLLRRGLGVARSRRRRRAGRCPDCGYDLRASPGQCPECGVGTSA